MAKRIHDLETLVIGAVKAITKALDDGDKGGKHEPGTWVEESLENQIIHCDDHLTDIKQIVYGQLKEDSPAHLVCRAVMLYIKYYGLK